MFVVTSWTSHLGQVHRPVVALFARPKALATPGLTVRASKVAIAGPETPAAMSPQTTAKGLALVGDFASPRPT
jgi:hypothetical protein